MIQWERRLCTPFIPAPPMHAARQMYDGGIAITGPVSKEPHHTYGLVCWNYLKAVTALYGASSTPRPVSKLRYFLCPMCVQGSTDREREIYTFLRYSYRQRVLIRRTCAGRPIACATTIDYRPRRESARLDCHPLICEGNWGSHITVYRNLRMTSFSRRVFTC